MARIRLESVRHSYRAQPATRGVARDRLEAYAKVRARAVKVLRPFHGEHPVRSTSSGLPEDRPGPPRTELVDQGVEAERLERSAHARSGIGLVDAKQVDVHER